MVKRYKSFVFFSDENLKKVPVYIHSFPRGRNFFKKQFQHDILNSSSPETISYVRKNLIFLFDIKNLVFNCWIEKNIYSLDTLLRLIFTLLLVCSSGLLLHSAGVIVGNNGYLFIGPTNTGKSTIVKYFLSRGLLSNSSVLSDEVLPVMFNNKTVFTWHSPFFSEVSGEMNKDAVSMIKVKKIYFLSKPRYEKEEIKKMCEKDVFRCLLKNTLWFFSTGYFSKNIIDTVFNITKNIPGYRLQFTSKNIFSNLDWLTL